MSERRGKLSTDRTSHGLQRVSDAAARRPYLALIPLLLGLPFALRLVPIPAALLNPPVQSIALLDRDGTPLREARVSERFSREITLDAVPKHVVDAPDVMWPCVTAFAIAREVARKSMPQCV